MCVCVLILCAFSLFVRCCDDDAQYNIVHVIISQKNNYILSKHLLVNRFVLRYDVFNTFTLGV